MPTYDIRPLQLKILPIIKAVDNACHQHGLRYYIWAGTMIGAVRHKGFIPWDDDLDIAMPRADYDKLIAHCKEWLPEPFEMVCAENDDVYPLPFAKIQDGSTTLIERMHLKYLGGIYLDVFPIDGAPKGWLAQKWHFGRYEYYKRVLYLLFRDPYKHGHGPSSWIPLLCRKLYSLAEVQNKIRQILTKYHYDDCNLVADYDDGSKGVMQKSVIGTPTPYEFEGITVMGVEHYDTYLTNKYGDYMTIPDGNHQHQHNFHYLDLEKPYKTYREQTR
jgi:lipopolysaccharide cholinephosphotransferase